MAGQYPAPLPHLGLVLTGVVNSSQYPAPLPSLGLVMAQGTGVYVLTATVGTYALTGVGPTLKYGHRLVSAAGAHTLTGVAATLTKSGINSTQYPAPLPSLSSLLSGASGIGFLTASPGTFTLSGTAAVLTKGVALSAASGTFVATGAPALRDMQVTASGSAYAISGSSATLTATHLPLTAATGTYVMTGQAAALISQSDKIMLGGTGAYTLTGVAATLSYPGRVLQCAPGTFAETGYTSGYQTTGRFSPNVVPTGGFAAHFALAPRIERKRRAQIAGEVAKKPAPEVVQRAALDVAHEWLAGDLVDEAAARNELERLVIAQGARWRPAYETLLRAYHTELQAEQARQMESMAANEQEYKRIQRNQNAARVLLLMNM